jgi:hypothetical protein
VAPQTAGRTGKLTINRLLAAIEFDGMSIA